jgi:hypothetical protein
MGVIIESAVFQPLDWVTYGMCGVSLVGLPSLAVGVVVAFLREERGSAGRMGRHGLWLNSPQLPATECRGRE